VAHTIKTLEVISFRCSGILHIANFLILSPMKLLIFNVGCHFIDGFSRKPSQTPYRPTNSNQSKQCQFLVLCAIEHSFPWMRQQIAMKTQFNEDSTCISFLILFPRFLFLFLLFTFFLPVYFSIYYSNNHSNYSNDNNNK